MGRSKDLATGETRFANVAGDTFTGTVIHNGNVGIGTSPSVPLQVVKAGGANWMAQFQNTTSATPYGVNIYDASSASNGYPLLQVTNSAGSTTYFRVDSGTGAVTMPKQPVAVAYYNAQTQDGAYGATNKNNIVCKPGATHINEGTMYDSSTGRFTIPVAGKYFAMVSGSQRDLNVSNYHYVFIRKSGTIQKYIYNTLSSNSSGWTHLSGSTIFDCSVNDYIDFFNKHGSSTNADMGGWDIQQYTQFVVYKIS